MLCAIDGTTGVVVAKTILRDVAEVAGVSMRTASRVLNDDPRVAVDTRARVQQAMRDLQFIPDSLARSLRAGTDTAVGMVVESVADPFFSAMVAAVEQAEPTVGKSVLIASTHGDATRERDVVAQMLSRRVSGLLLAPTTGDHAWLQTNTPLVLVDRAAPGLDADVVGIDDEAAAADAVHHLVAHGHRRIAYVSDLPLVPTSRARLVGYRRAMAEHGLDADPRLVRACCPDAASAAAATRELLDHNGSDRPTALLSAATRCSLGVVPTLHAIGRTDIALVCFGDFAMADLLQPGVTVVDHSAEAVGAAAAARLAERIANPDLPASVIHVPVRLIPRGSGELRP
jgi:LacI family transcriptional regulator